MEISVRLVASIRILWQQFIRLKILSWSQMPVLDLHVVRIMSFFWAADLFSSWGMLPTSDCPLPVIQSLLSLCGSRGYYGQSLLNSLWNVFLLCLCFFTFLSFLSSFQENFLKFLLWNSYFYYNCSLSYLIVAFNLTSYTQVGFIILSILTQSYWCSLLVKGWFLCLNSPIQKYVMSLH